MVPFPQFLAISEYSGPPCTCHLIQVDILYVSQENIPMTHKIQNRYTGIYVKIKNHVRIFVLLPSSSDREQIDAPVL